jgi:hypothetical protein
MKRFYSCIDSTLLVPQPVQHLVIKDRAEKAGGSIVFYGAEDQKGLRSQPFILPKLRRTPDIDGVVFFTFHQFRYGSELNFFLLKTLLQEKYETHFGREGLSIATVDELNELYPFLMSIDYTLRRDASDAWKSVLCGSSERDEQR